MKRSALSDMTVPDVVEKFLQIALAQDQALELDDMPRYNKLFYEMEAVELELKCRDGDARGALMALYKYPNVQVRLTAATATLAVAPEKAKAMIQEIRESAKYPQALVAGMRIRNLDSGLFKPT